jgi:tripartite-type tricarboxylate transporter receptor subunit TctC
MLRRTLLATPLALAAPALAQVSGGPIHPSAPVGAPAIGPRWPDRPIRMIVPFPAGGSLDVLTRLSCEAAQQSLGQPIIVENRPGAGGNIGTDQVAKSPGDGYTLGSVSVGLLSINQYLFSSMPFDFDRELTGISLIYELPNIAVVAPQFNESRSLAEFIAWAKTRPQGVTFGSPGIGTTPHLAGALFAQRAGYNGIHVPFRGAAQGVPAVLSGSVEFSLDNLASWMPVLGEGRARGLAVTSAERWPTLPNVPTMAEAGMPDFVVTSWAAIIAPIGTPKPVVERISAAFRAAAEMPHVQARMLQSGGRAVWTSPEATMARARAERPMWQEMVRVSGAKAD